MQSKRESGGVIEIVQHRHSPVEKLSVKNGELRVGPLAPMRQEKASPRSFELNSFHRNIVDGAIEELSRWGYRAQIRMNSDLLDSSLLTDINGSDRSGVLLIGEYSNDLSQFIRHCMHPLVLVDIIGNGVPDVVTTDNFEGIREAFDHLYQLGHRKIGFIGRRDEIVALAERFTAYKLKMTEHNLPVTQDWIYEGYDHIEHTAAAVSSMLSHADRPTALMCSNDCDALGVVRAASGLGISIPGELSVMGFDDVDFASLITPPLTTVRVPVQEMGRQAVRQLMIQLKGGSPTKLRGCHVRLLPELIVRESTAPVRV
ncbi:hypothetical protein BH10PLA1_BH10PLA1_13450 [soil metagenome]